MNPGYSAQQIEQAAAELLRQHQQNLRFGGLSAPAPLPDADAAYRVQDAFVQRKCEQLNTRTAGYKIALTTLAMQEMVGYRDSVSGRLLGADLQHSQAQLHMSRYGRLAIEFEIAFEMKNDLPQTSSAWGHDIADHVLHAFPALELIDDRQADYGLLRQDILTLVADNAWNAGLIMGEPIRGQDLHALDQAAGVALIDGQEVGRGTGRDVLGHPLTALAWLANHLKARGLSLRRGEIITTGSLVKSQFPAAGNLVCFQLAGAAEVSARLL